MNAVYLTCLSTDNGSQNGECQLGNMADLDTLMSKEGRRVMEIIFFVAISGSISVFGSVGNVINIVIFFKQVCLLARPIQSLYLQKQEQQCYHTKESELVKTSIQIQQLLDQAVVLSQIKELRLECFPLQSGQTSTLFQSFSFLFEIREFFYNPFLVHVKACFTLFLSRRGLQFSQNWIINTIKLYHWLQNSLLRNRQKGKLKN